MRVLAQEPIAWMNRVAATLLRSSDDGMRIEIGRGSGSAQSNGGISRSGVQRLGVIRGMGCHRGDAKIGGGARDADSNLAAIGDEGFSDDVSQGLVLFAVFLFLAVWLYGVGVAKWGRPVG